ncbi:histone deacetylase 14, partial [Tanacetum coccineum]
TPEPEWTIPPNDFPEPENNWANTYATTYQVPAENKLQRKTYDIGSFIKWFCRRTGKKKLYKADLEGPAFNLVKAFHKNNVFLQYQMDECHKLLTNKVDLGNPEGHQILRNIYEPLPLGGPPGQRSLLHDNIVPKPDLALELGKSISLTEAEEEAVAREVHATHARIVSESEPEPTQRRQFGIAFRDSFIVSKKRSSDSSKKLKGIQTLTPAKQEAAHIMKQGNWNKRRWKWEAQMKELPGVPDEEKLILEWEADVDSEHFDRDDNVGDDNEETKPDPEEIYKPHTQSTRASVDNISSDLVSNKQKASDYDISGPVPPRKNVVSLADKTDSSQKEIEFLLNHFFEEYFSPINVHAEEYNNDQAANASRMFPFERYMKKLKNYVRNKAKPEGSIAEGYVAEEELTFCSRYLKDDVETRFNRLGSRCSGPFANRWVE